ncbi:MAG: molybdate ABC transporter permease subunit [Coriobacteriia bacterium]|nr:molybdate ABC transporter permease subunit [Coriobacteriia bacterium]
MRRVKTISSWAVTLLVVLNMCFPALAFADDALGDANTPAVTSTSSSSEGSSAASDVTVSSENDAAIIDGVAFGLSAFSRAQKGSNRDIGEAYAGYSYYSANETGYLGLIATTDYVVVYVPPAVAQTAGFDVSSEKDKQSLRHLFIALDEATASGGALLSDDMTWYFTEDPIYKVGTVEFRFDQELKNGQYYASIIGEDGTDVTASTGSGLVSPTHADFAQLLPSDQVGIAQAPTGLEAFGQFLTTLDWSPLWITLKTTLTAIVFIFILGLAAAYFILHLPPRAQDIFDSIFTIPMVLPPTVCGFILLWLCGKNTPFGQFFIDIGFPLIFSWPATVIAAVIVAFPLMYRSARGAFENLEPNMLDAARTLGWSNARIFFKLMLPLSWSSIAAGTVLSFARALGEFGATLFLAGNYLGITRTIPIAIYFEWMNGNNEIAWFWTFIIIVFSFIVILFINLWSSHTTKYRRGSAE